METYRRNEKEQYSRNFKIKKTLINWSQEIINSFTFIDGRRLRMESWNPKMESQRKLKTTQKDIKTF